MSKFEVGDKVICPTCWDGTAKVIIVDDLRNTYPVAVDTGDTIYRFTEDGRALEYHLQPSLFHAGTKITIEEAQPKRWPWVNVYEASDGRIHSGNSHATKEKALSNNRYCHNAAYLFPCQLKPEETK